MADLWNLSNKEELLRFQHEYSQNILIQPLVKQTGIVIGYDSTICDNRTIGNFTYFDLETCDIIDVQNEVLTTNNEEYESGYLALREIPIFKILWENRKFEPDLIVVDGNGILHQRKCGLATHISFLTNRPTFGIAKKLVGGNFKQFEYRKGSFSEIIWNEETLGVALCTNDNTKPVFVSIGNRITLEECITISLNFSKFRIPELTRQPDISSREHCRNLSKPGTI